MTKLGKLIQFKRHKHNEHDEHPEDTMTPQHSSATTPDGTRDLTVDHSRPSPRVKLPKLLFKKFNGDLMKWATFWDTFESAIHDNPALGSIDKFNYLNLLLDSAASEAIAGLMLTSANYEEAIVTLKH